jgi:diguanylate cyclase (GGDEF)-like protein
MNDSSPRPVTDPIEALQAEIKRLHAEAGRNVNLFRRMLDRELAILEAQTLPELLGVIVDGLRSSHGVESVTLVVQDPQHEIRHLLLGDGHMPDAFAGVVFVDSVVMLAPQMRSLVRPWLGPYVGSDHQLLFPGAEGLASVAIMPLIRGRQLVGSLNFGSVDAQRFTAAHGSDFLGRLGMITGLAIDNACNRARLMHAGLTDYLTGWHNRRYLHSRLREEIARSQRQGTATALLMMDLDRFKEINDNCGHLGGDIVIREVAMRIDGQIRVSDAAARFGGDEFAVLLTGAGLDEARLIADRIIHAVSASPVDLGSGVTRTVTLSIGIAVTAPGATAGDLKSRADKLLAEADAALYRAKSAGRNRIEVAR